MSRVEGWFCRSGPWRAFTRRRALPWVLQGRSLTGAVLEVGGGSGANARAMAEFSPGIELTVTDVDPTMVAAARSRLVSVRPEARVELADVTALPFEDESFDVVVSLLMLHHVIGWQAALSECRRVLRPGGFLVGYDLIDTAPARLIHRLDRSPHRMIAADELAEELASDGFTSIGTASGFFGLVSRFAASKPADA